MTAFQAVLRRRRRAIELIVDRAARRDLTGDTGQAGHVGEADREIERDDRLLSRPIDQSVKCKE